MERFLFLDLDDTVFQTRAKCGPDPDPTAAAYLKDGSPISYCTSRQRAFLEMFVRELRIIPTTARNLDAFKRVALPFSEMSILDHGGIIIDAGREPDRPWLERMRQLMSPTIGLLHELAARIRIYGNHRGIEIGTRVIGDCGLDLYVLVKHAKSDTTALQAMLDGCVGPWIARAGTAFKTHLNGNNLAILPAFLDKSHAVAYVIERLTERYGDILTIGMGDSMSDREFVLLCDYALVPKGTQLHASTLGRS
ncbi:MAG: hypothetical protein ACREWG_02645 [Gammaproteobacteria bacterium]